MAGTSKIVWRGTVEMGQNCTLYGNKVIEAAQKVLEYFQPIFETYAKQQASWTDRTGNARQSLHAEVEQLSKDAVALYLAHGVQYGIWLEVRWSGKFSILWPTIQAHLGDILKMLQEIFS